ncbi:carbohydrate-binding module family 50 protein [Amniculicola lignicola CBS 123094]|uniref:Carbohydrate-binding module family 50 protein n=1 Tax=Amniculicola lignicola CBS 123094 TaxID=1392246 RepID=A0A6A5X0N4_9PLEO|nr:carbohydrate-binding module family 50 protein [Amniculicola lignicola CBS 123094]
MITISVFGMHHVLCIFLFIFASFVSAANNVIFKNQCSYPIYFWTVRPETAAPDNTYISVPAYGEVYHPMERPKGGGISLKIRDVPYYAVAPSGVIQAEYAITDHGLFYYDLSAIDCNKNAGPEAPDYCPLVAGGVTMQTTSTDKVLCPVATCAGTGWTCGNSTYLNHGTWMGEPSYGCAVGNDIIVETCTQGDGVRTIPRPSDIPPPPPPPAPAVSSIAPLNPPPPPPPSASSYTPPPTITRDADGRPSPTQPGTVKNCDGFHMVVESDTCWDISRAYGIELSEFYNWNKNVGENCETLWLGYYACVRVANDLPPPLASSSTISSKEPLVSKTSTWVYPTESSLVSSSETYLGSSVYTTEPSTTYRTSSTITPSESSLESSVSTTASSISYPVSYVPVSSETYPESSIYTV